jgi:hypothetical protein
MCVWNKTGDQLDLFLWVMIHCHLLIHLFTTFLMWQGGPPSYFIFKTQKENVRFTTLIQQLMWDPPSCEGLLYSCCIGVVQESNPNSKSSRGPPYHINNVVKSCIKRWQWIITLFLLCIGKLNLYLKFTTKINVTPMSLIQVRLYRLPIVSPNNGCCRGCENHLVNCLCLCTSF